MIREFEINCPECAGWIRIDLESGEVLAHGKKGQRKSEAAIEKLEDAFDKVRKREARTDDTFADAMKSVADQKRKLDDAFEEAKKKAAQNPDDRPRNPLDDLFAD